MNHRSRFLALAACICVFAAGCTRLQPLSSEEAQERLSVATSKVYDAQGQLIADLHHEINRDIAPLSQIPRHVRNAVIAIEDERFWRHQGLDLRSITRAAVNNLRSESEQRQLQGGSTISQQLAKNLYFIRPDRTISRKLAEARVTWQLERQYTKAEILEMYLNTIYLGRGVYGVETAARSYFGKSVSELTLVQGAFLAGLIHEPGRYEWSPKDPAEQRDERIALATNRRNYVLARMNRLDMISDDELSDAKAQPIEVNPPTEREWKHPYFVNFVLRQLGVLRSPRPLDPRFDFLGTSYGERGRNVHLRGLRIYTSLDAKAQTAAEQAIDEQLPKELTKLSAALAAIEPRTGYVRALVGGRDYYPDCNDQNNETHMCRLQRVNMALGNFGGGSGRQPGSSFKPFVLAAALQRGVPLFQTYASDPFEHTYLGGVWKVSNYEGSGGGHISLIDATARSVNAAYARLEIDGVGEGDGMKGADLVADVARRMGIGFPTREQLRERCGESYARTDACLAANDTPSIALGAKEVSPLDMASAYATFANDGMRREITAIVRIEDANGKVLYDARPRAVRAIPSGVARGVTYALQEVIKRGTGTQAAIGRPAAAKTGTSQAWRDAWLAGYVPQLATVVWVGNPIPIPGVGNESMIPSNGYPVRVVGGSYPAMIWREFMSRALEGVPVRDFRPPPSVLFRGMRGPIETPEPSPSPTPTPSLTPEPEETEEPPEAGTVPSVVGMSFGQARSEIEDAGFAANTVRGCDPRRRARLHEVYAQSPGGGTQAAQGSTVTAYYQGGGCPERDRDRDRDRERND